MAEKRPTELTTRDANGSVRRPRTGYPPIVLVLSAGAVHSPLMAGVLYALYRYRNRVTHIWASGGGAFVGLLFIAPKKPNEGPEALRRINELGVSDVIYQLLPIPYKTFFKPGPFTKPFQDLAHKIKFGSPDSGGKRLYNDIVDLACAVATPTFVTYFSRGLCGPPHFIDDLVDFAGVAAHPTKFSITAYNLRIKDLVPFSNQSPTPLTADHVRASVAYPFIYPPVQLSDGDLYVEGAIHKSIYGPEPDALLRKFLDDLRVESIFPTVIVVDILASLKQVLLREPENLWDAYGLSLITPAVAMAERDLTALQQKHEYDIRLVDFDIPESRRRHIFEWTRSNLEELWEIGRRAGENLVAANNDIFPRLD